MRILTRYVIAEFMKVFLVALTALTTFMLLVGLVKRAYEENLGVLQIVRILPYFLPEALRFSVPGTALFAACMLYGRMSAANEVVSLKALGISPWPILWPVCAVTFLLSLGTVWLNDVAVTWGYRGARRVLLEGMDDIIYHRLRVQKSFSAYQFSINVKQVDGRRLMQPTISFEGSGDTGAGTVQAEEAELEVNTQTDALTMTCWNAVVDFAGEATARFPKIVREISLAEAHGSRGVENLPARMPLSELTARAAAAVIVLRDTEQRMAIKSAGALLRGDTDTLESQDWQNLHTKLEFDRYYVARLRLESPRRWANGLSCLCFMWIGAPMAIRLRNADVLTSFFLCFLPILVVYYPLLMAGIDQGKRGAWPPYFVWAGNVALFLWGCWLLRRVVRY